MLRRALAALSLAAGLTGCATVGVKGERDSRLAEEALASAATQVQRCYRAPRVSFEGRQIVTRLRIRLTPEGQVAALPAIVEQLGLTATNQPYAGRMAQAAVTAVMRCAPLRLPETFYHPSGVVFDLTFSPVARG